MTYGASFMMKNIKNRYQIITQIVINKKKEEYKMKVVKASTALGKRLCEIGQKMGGHFLKSSL